MLHVRHGYTNHPAYNTWRHIKRRCYNPNSNVYKYYGGRGISVCDEWRTNAGAFIDWCLKNGWKKGLEIDRIDNQGDYSPENCRIVNRKQNNRNKRSNLTFLWKGKMRTMIEISEMKGCVYSTVKNRVKNGWSIKDAVLQPATIKSKPVVCVNTGEKFESIKQASVVKKISTVSIQKVLSGKLKSTKGLKFDYINQKEKLENE